MCVYDRQMYFGSEVRAVLEIGMASGGMWLGRGFWIFRGADLSLDFGRSGH